MEKIDLYDENRNLLGETIARGEPIAVGKYKLSMHMWITDSLGRVYIQKRAARRKLFPNMWENPGGGVVSGQNTEETLKREFEEELGIKLTGTYNLIKTIKRSKDFVDIFHVRQDFDICKLNLQEEEVSEAKWVTIDEIKAMINREEFCPTIMDSFVPFLEYLEI